MPMKNERKYLLSFIMILVLTLCFLGGMVNAESGENEIENDIAKMYEHVEIRKNHKAMKAYLLHKPTRSQTYEVGDELNLVGLQVSVWYDDLSIEEIDWRDERIYAEGFDSQEVGNYLVKIYFKDGECFEKIDEFVAIINEPSPKKRGMIKNNIDTLGEDDFEEDSWWVWNVLPPTKTVYLVGEEIDLTGMKATIRHSDGWTETVDYDDPRINLQLEPYDNTMVGARKLRYSYFETDYEVTTNFDFYFIFKEDLSDKIVVKLALIDFPESWETVDEEEVVDWTGASFQVEYDDGSTNIIEYDEHHFWDREINSDFMWLEYYEDEEYFGEFESPRIIVDKIDFIQGKSIVSDNYNKNVSIQNDRNLLKQDVYDLSSVSLPETYNIKNYLDVIAGNQGWEGLCWDFASTKSLETNYYLKNGINYDLSEKFADYMTSELFYNYRELGSGGTASTYFETLEKIGVPLEETVPYHNVDESEYDTLENVEKVVIPVGVIDFPYQYEIEITENKEVLHDLIKAHIMEYGSVYCSVHWGGYNYGTNSFYYEKGVPYSAGHAISIVGWDDNYSKDNFEAEQDDGTKVYPEHDGAWIALNSWGPEWGDGNGLFYISYDTQDIDYYGVLLSAPYIPKEQYSYTDDKGIGFHYDYQDTENEKYLYVEYDKDDEIEYLTNIIIPKFEGVAKIYLLQEGKEVSEAELLGSTVSEMNTVTNFVLDEPKKIEGNSFTIILKVNEMTRNSFITKKTNQSHTYYSTDDEMTLDWEQFDGELFMFVYTITEEQYEETLENVVDSIEIIVEPDKVEYMQGEEISLEGGTIKVTYTDGRVENKDMADDDVYFYGYSSYNKNVGSQTMTVLYGGKSDTFEITIRDDVVGIEMNTYPTKSVYDFEWDDLDITGGTLKVTYSNGDFIVLDLSASGIEIDQSEFDTSNPGIQTIYVQYQGFETSFDIEMLKALSWWFADSLPDKTEYYVGEMLDLTGGIMIIHYADGDSETVNFSDDDRIQIYVTIDSDEWIWPEDEDLVDFTKPLDTPGKYIYYVTMRKGNYSSEDSWTVTVKNPPDPRTHYNLPLVLSDPYEYNGEMIEPILNGFFEEAMIKTGDISAKEVGEYELTVSLKNPEESVWLLDYSDFDETISTEPQTIHWAIKPAVTWAYIPSQYEIYFYTGEEIEWSGDLWEYDDSIHTLEGTKGKNAGVYQTILELKDDKNYVWGIDEDDRRTSTWEIIKAMPEIDVINRNQVEGDITPIEITSTPAITDGTVKVLYSVKNGTGYTEEVPTEAGLYKIKVSISGDSNLYNTEISDFLLIEKAKEMTTIPIPTMKSNMVTYTGEEILVIDGLYDAVMSYSGEKATNVGHYTATVSIKDKENFRWTDGTQDDLTFEYDVTKATFTAELTNDTQTAGQVVAADVVFEPELTNGEVTILYSDGGDFVADVPSKAGTYTVKVSVSGDTNIEDGEAEFTLTINKAVSGGGSSSGGSSTNTSKTYTISVEESMGGVVQVDKTQVQAGEDVTVLVIPAKNYHVKKLLVDNINVGSKEEYVIENVKKSHTVKAVFEKDSSDTPSNKPSGSGSSSGSGSAGGSSSGNGSSSGSSTPSNSNQRFVDVNPSDWYYEAVNYAVDKQWFNGMSETEFAPSNNLTRAMLVTILYRFAGANEEATNVFTDVAIDTWYAKAVTWAAKNGIVNGMGEGIFNPNGNITRQDLITIMYRYAKFANSKVNATDNSSELQKYEDAKEIRDYAKEAFTWGIENGIVSGRSETTLAPSGLATRAEAATIIQRLEKVK